MDIDLNSDLGESFGNYHMGNDAEVMTCISSANIACGFHAGDPIVMKNSVINALEKGVAIGAHPGLPDLMGFGRRTMQISPEELKAYVIYQVGALAAFVKSEGGQLQHVKLHGALYNMAADHEALSSAFCEAVRSVDEGLTILALSGSKTTQIAQKMGLKTASEVFADRAYADSGQLLSRQLPGAMIHNQDEVLKRVVEMVKNKRVQTVTGSWLNLSVDSVCLHGDHPEAVALSKAIQKTLLNEGCSLKPFGRNEG